MWLLQWNPVPLVAPRLCLSFVCSLLVTGGRIILHLFLDNWRRRRHRVSDHPQQDSSFNNLFKLTSNKKWKPRNTGCFGKRFTDDWWIPSQMASDAEDISISKRPRDPIVGIFLLSVCVGDSHPGWVAQVEWVSSPNLSTVAIILW